MSGLRITGSSLLYIAVTAFVGALPLAFFLIAAFSDLGRVFARAAPAIWLMLLMVGIGSLVLTLAYWVILKGLERLRSGFSDWQVILLYLLNPLSIWIFVDWYLRRDKIGFPELEIILPIAGFLLSWLVFRLLRAQRTALASKTEP